jgi:hypothetical protein
MDCPGAGGGRYRSASARAPGRRKARRTGKLAQVGPHTDVLVDMRATKDLHLCGACRRPFVVPDAIVSAPGGVAGVVVELRCTDCGWTHVGVYPQAAVEELDRQLDLSERQIRTALEVAELANELDRIDRFARALQLDLITPEDF